MSINDEALRSLKKDEVKFVDFRFTDMLGQCHHITRDVDYVDEEVLEQGFCFDGSSIKGWKAINESDMLLMPDVKTMFRDPFAAQDSMIMHCTVYDPKNGERYNRDPRSTVEKALEFLRETGIADDMIVGPELEFFIFDDARFSVDYNQSFYHVDSVEHPCNSGREYEFHNNGYRPREKGGYMPVSPTDSLSDIRSEILSLLKAVGISPTLHHHEVAPSQSEIGFQCTSISNVSDYIQKAKYVVQNVANSYGKTATFMPKPLKGDNGNGMHFHQSLSKNGKNIFASEDGSDLSEICKYYIGGILKHGRALTAFTNPTTNSYRRLIKGFEAPIYLAYSNHNRSAAIRIPFDPTGSPKGKRIELRFPDTSANPYYAPAAMLLAGIDGILNKIDPSDKYVTENLYESKNTDKYVNIPSSLEEALQALEDDHAFLLQGGVFDHDVIEAYTNLKIQEVNVLKQSPHPIEFINYYDC